MEEYFNAKYNISINQTPDQYLVTHSSVNNFLIEKNNHKSKIFFYDTKPFVWFDTSVFASQLRRTLTTNGLIVSQKTIPVQSINKKQSDVLPVRRSLGEDGSERTEGSMYRNRAPILKELGERIRTDNPISYPANWQIIEAASNILNLKIDNINFDDLNLPDHRLDLVATINGIEFYDDSKSTIGEATLAAVEKLKDRPIILFIGGLSKGVDRSNLIKNLYGKVSQVICFGAEAEKLYSSCQENKIISSAHKTLEDGFQFALKKAQPESRILFSPAGSSYDLFKDYKDRGKKFRELVQKISMA